MKNKIKVIIFLIFLLSVTASCSGKQVQPPDDLFITVEDVENVKAGEYGLRYTINNFSEYESKYNLKINAYVYDSVNASVEVRNNRTVTLEAEKEYEAVIVLYGWYDKNNEQTKFTVTASYKIKTEFLPRTVNFYDKQDKLLKTYDVPYGGNFYDYYELPEPPDIVTEPGHYDTTVYTNKRWEMIFEGEMEYLSVTRKLVDGYLKNIRDNIYIFATYDEEIISGKSVITFVTNCDVTIEPYEVAPENYVLPSLPKREGYVFYGWYIDEELKEIFNSPSVAIHDDLTLYAKWVEVFEGATPNRYFTFEEETDYGYRCYNVSAKDKDNLPKDLVIPNEYDGFPVKFIKGEGFSDTDIETVTIPDSVSIEASSCFMNCKKLREIYIGEDNVTIMIGDKSFSGCIALESITLPKSVKTIYSEAFCECRGLTQIVLSENLMYINKRAFYNCVSLENVSLPESVSAIASFCFENCTSLSSLNIPETTELTSIGEYVLLNTAVTEVYLPLRLKADQPFADCDGVTVSYYDGNN